MRGSIHSIESFGTLDGPGTRLVIFFQGCPMRCLYCHNPDTWQIDNKKMMTVQEIIELYYSNQEFYQNGGLTVSGGEPLLQLDFLIALFKEAKKNNIHTCCDTSGICFREEDIRLYNELIKYTDLFLLDLKQIDDLKHYELTQMSNQAVLRFAQYLSKANIPTIIRYVLVPTITDDKQSLIGLGMFVQKLKNVKKIEILPYHKMGIEKYKKANLKYSLENIPAANSLDIQEAKKYVIEGYKSKIDHK